MYDPEKHHRRSLRLEHYDYSQPGRYYVTIVVQGRRCLFGDVVDAQMVLNEAGKMATDTWLSLFTRFRQTVLDDFIIMPNHMHGIVSLGADGPVVGAPLVGAHGSNAEGGHKARPYVAHGSNAEGGHKARPYAASADGSSDVRPCLGDIAGAFKSLTTLAYIRAVKQHCWPRFNGSLWQQNYYEHVVRDEFELEAIRDCIRNNPLNWSLDRENPMAPADEPEEPWRS